MFQTNSTTIAIFLAAAVAVLIWVILNKTTFGYELKAVGLNKSAARYAGNQREEEHHPLHGHCRRSGRLRRRTLLPV